jgi:hypothetical protein
MKTRIDILPTTPEQRDARELRMQVTYTEVEDCVAELGRDHVWGPKVPNEADGWTRRCKHCPWLEFLFQVDTGEPDE